MKFALQIRMDFEEAQNQSGSKILTIATDRFAVNIAAMSWYNCQKKKQKTKTQQQQQHNCSQRLEL